MKKLTEESKEFQEYKNTYTKPKITDYQWEALKKEAKRLLRKEPNAHPTLRAHWESIANS